MHDFICLNLSQAFLLVMEASFNSANNDNICAAHRPPCSPKKRVQQQQQQQQHSFPFSCCMEERERGKKWNEKERNKTFQFRLFLRPSPPFLEVTFQRLQLFFFYFFFWKWRAEKARGGSNSSSSSSSSTSLTSHFLTWDTKGLPPPPEQESKKNTIYYISYTMLKFAKPRFAKSICKIKILQLKKLYYNLVSFI